MAETAKKISMIPAKVQYDRNVKLSEKKMKVAAYCRVSTELEEQDSSYEAQVEYYTSKISENENWKNAGIYADDGKSGTNTKKRADFNAMIQDALAGKIDMIVFCQALFPEKSVRIPCFRQGNFPAFGGAQLRIPTHEGMLHPVAFSLKD